jgi:hypothetical protein
MDIRITITAEDKATADIGKVVDKVSKEAEKAAKKTKDAFGNAAEDVVQNMTGMSGSIIRALKTLTNPIALAVAAVIGIGLAFFKMAQMAADATADTNAEAAAFNASLSRIGDSLTDIGIAIASELIPIFNEFFRLIGFGADETERLFQQQQQYNTAILAQANASRIFFENLNKLSEASGAIQTELNSLYSAYLNLQQKSLVYSGQSKKDVDEELKFIEKRANLLLAELAPRAEAAKTTQDEKNAAIQLLPAVKEVSTELEIQHLARLASLNLLFDENAQLQEIAVVEVQSATLDEIRNDKMLEYIGFLAQANTQMAQDVRFAQSLVSVLENGLSSVSGLIASGVVNFDDMKASAAEVGKQILTSIVAALAEAILRATILRAILGFFGIPIFGGGGIVGAGLPAYQTGAIVRRPTVALVGEEAAEAIVPLAPNRAAEREAIMAEAGLAGGAEVFNFNVAHLDEVFVRTRLIPILNREAKRGTPIFSTKTL